MKKKTLREDRTTADRKMSINRPAAGGESRKRDSILIRGYTRENNYDL